MSTVDAPESAMSIAGNPTDEEIAALVAMLAAARPVAPPTPPAASGWAAHWRRIGADPAPGPDTWRLAAR